MGRMQGRLACVEVFQLTIQLLVRRHPSWQPYPVAVIDRDHPQGELLAVNRHAEAALVRPGMRYGAAMALSGDLRAAVVDARAIAAAREEVTELLKTFSATVEPHAGAAGTWWLHAEGYQRLHGDSYPRWARAIHARILSELGLWASVYVGTSRLGTMACARSWRGVHVFESAGAERAQALCAPLARFDIEPEAVELLRSLGASTLGDLVELPRAGLRDRVGASAHALHRRAHGELFEPLVAHERVAPLQRELDLPAPESDRQRLGHAIALTLDVLLDEARERHQELARLAIVMVGERGARLREVLAPAEPTLEHAQLTELVALMLERIALSEPVVRLCLDVEARDAEHAQLQVVACSGRDLGAAARALARLRAEFGPESVYGLSLTSHHLPEARCRREPLKLRLPEPASRSTPTLVRRLAARAIALPSRRQGTPRGWLLGAAAGAIVAAWGPYRLSGGWWQEPWSRELWFVETQQNELHWIYYDRRARRWFSQGRVE